MRRVLIALIPVVTITAAWAGGGVYATLPARDSAACARLCADDALCMAWTLRPDNLCDLRATVPEASATGGTTGLSSRAPGGMRSWTQISNQAAATALATEPGAASAQAQRPEDDISAMLLGGPDDDLPLE